MTPKNVTRPSLIEAAERRAYVLEQRRGGSTYREIAQLAIKRFGVDRLPKGYDERYACDDVLVELRRLREHISEQATEIVQLELVRLDKMLSAVWTDVLAGNQGAIDRALAIMKRRADFLGLDAPKRTELTGAGGQALAVSIYLPDNGRGDAQSD